MVQLLYVPSGRALKVIVLLPDEVELSELLQSPPYVMSPASFELKVYLDVLSLDGVGTAVTWLSDGAVASMVKEFTDKVLLVLLALSLTVMVQSL